MAGAAFCLPTALPHLNPALSSKTGLFAPNLVFFAVLPRFSVKNGHFRHLGNGFPMWGKWFSHMEKRFFPLAEGFCKLVGAVSRLGKRFRKLVRTFSKLAEGLGDLGKGFRKLENRSAKSINCKIALATPERGCGGWRGPAAADRA
jgi:hypothetical protein